MRNGKYLGLWTGFSVCSWPKPCNYLEIEDSVAIMETAFICEVCCYLKKCSVAFSLAEIIVQSYICTKTFDSLGKKPILILTALFSWTFKWHSRKHFLLLKINSLIRNIHFFNCTFFMFSFRHFRNCALSHGGDGEKIMSILGRKQQNLSVWSGEKHIVNAGAESHWWEWLAHSHVIHRKRSKGGSSGKMSGRSSELQSPILWYIISVDPAYLCKLLLTPPLNVGPHKTFNTNSPFGNLCPKGLWLRFKFWLHFI